MAQEFYRYGSYIALGLAAVSVLATFVYGVASEIPDTPDGRLDFNIRVGGGALVSFGFLLAAIGLNAFAGDGEEEKADNVVRPDFGKPKR